MRTLQSIEAAAKDTADAEVSMITRDEPILLFFHLSDLFSILFSYLLCLIF